MRLVLNTFCIYVFLLFQAFGFYAKAQTKDVKIEILCEDADINSAHLANNAWNCIINDDKKYRKIIGGKSKIDFNKFTLLGVVYTAGGCDAPTVTHSVYFLVESNSYRFELNIQENGTCENTFQGNIWCLVPKIQSNKKINFIKRFSVKN